MLIVLASMNFSLLNATCASERGGLGGAFVLLISVVADVADSRCARLPVLAKFSEPSRVSPSATRYLVVTVSLCSEFPELVTDSKQIFNFVEILVSLFIFELVMYNIVENFFDLNAFDAC